MAKTVPLIEHARSLLGFTQNDLVGCHDSDAALIQFRFQFEFI